MNTYKYLLEKSNKDINYIRSYVYKNYIKTVVENSEDNSNRVMFIANRFKSDFNNPMSFECNGLIADYNKVNNSWKLLVIPTELFNSQKLIKSEIINYYNQNNYKLCKVYDGTIINLYYYKDCWRISTNKAYDANNLIYTDNKTYLDVFNELLNNYPNFHISKLDTNKCYTLCLKYHKYHPFIENQNENPNKIILIQSVDMNEFNNNKKLKINENEDLGFEMTEKYDINNYKNLQNLYLMLNNEINRFKKESKLENYKPVFGFILRSKNFAVTKNYSNILLESNLLSKIRNFIYNHNFTKKLHFYNILDTQNSIVINKNYYSMLHLICLRVFLLKKDANLFITLFPQLKETMVIYEHFMKFLTKYIIKNYNIFMKSIINIDKIFKNELVLDTIPIPIDGNIDYSKLNKLVIIILVDLKEKKINLNVSENYDILYDYLNNLIYLDYYYSYFN
jgi:hypothetical protein